MGHYDEYYEERDRSMREYRQKQVEESVSEIKKEIINALSNEYDFKGYKVNLVEGLACCRVYKFNENALEYLLTEIVKELHK